MKRLFLFPLFVLAAMPAFAESNTLADYKQELWIKIISAIVVLLVIVIHTIVTLVKQRGLRTNYTVAEFSKNRTDASLGAMTKEEIAALNTSLDSIDNIWGEIIDTQGDTITYPHKKSSVKQSLAILQQAIDANPTDKGVVEKINSYNEVLNHAISRQFNGSKTVIALFTIIGLITAVAFPPMLAIVALGITAYILASRTPNFMLIEQITKNNNRSGSWVKRTLLSLLSGVTAAKSDKTEKNQTWFSLLLVFVFTLVIAILLPVITLVNYTRNYLIYR